MLLGVSFFVGLWEVKVEEPLGDDNHEDDVVDDEA